MRPSRRGARRPRRAAESVCFLALFSLAAGRQPAGRAGAEGSSLGWAAILSCLSIRPFRRASSRLQQLLFSRGDGRQRGHLMTGATVSVGRTRVSWRPQLFRVFRWLSVQLTRLNNGESSPCTRVLRALCWFSSTARNENSSEWARSPRWVDRVLAPSHPQVVGIWRIFWSFPRNFEDFSSITVA